MNLKKDISIATSLIVHFKLQENEKKCPVIKIYYANFLKVGNSLCEFCDQLYNFGNINKKKLVLVNGLKHISNSLSRLYNPL